MVSGKHLICKGWNGAVSLGLGYWCPLFLLGGERVKCPKFCNIEKTLMSAQTKLVDLDSITLTETLVPVSQTADKC